MGGISSWGLVPKSGPVFVQDFLKKHPEEGKKATMTATTYQELLESTQTQPKTESASELVAAKID